MEFSIEQQSAFDKYIQGKNIFITGPGGTGKTALIKYIYLDACKRNRNIQVCALTGCAAVLLECKAKTIHSWAGIGLAKGSIDSIVAKILKNYNRCTAWKQIDVLIIDEVSMMSQKMVELLDAVGRAVRKKTSNRPFGGIQLIFSGDFYQLPPIGSSDEPETMVHCFQSPLWYDIFTNDNHIELVQIFRQTDQVYVKILNQIRVGRLSQSSFDCLNKTVEKQFDVASLLKPTKLFPTKDKVISINNGEMSKLTTGVNEYKMRPVYNLPMTETEKRTHRAFSPQMVESEITYLQSNLLCDKIVQIKIGAQVMCIVNHDLDRGICNGSQGIVTGISEGMPIVRFNNGVELVIQYHVWSSETIPGIGITQLPLILSWALTIHKSQGTTLDIAEIDAGSGIFECGQTYVALSRVRSLDGLYLKSFDVTKIKINLKVKQFYEMLHERKVRAIEACATA